MRGSVHARARACWGVKEWNSDHQGMGGRADWSGGAGIGDRIRFPAIMRELVCRGRKAGRTPSHTHPPRRSSKSPLTRGGGMPRHARVDCNQPLENT